MTDSVRVGSVMIAPGMFMFFVSPMVAVFSARHLMDLLVNRTARHYSLPISTTWNVRSPSET